ncbi:LLM class flavin-dependent oxidoreductase [Paracraurococcus lichenis]|uniref:LLM class flavin-dependent oxidoreductase n=1 Tax=Paracraurococcus lichenis TaxID=3064888 RepID=A0ABT9E5Q6_9PROT|nr:LLM class flavin-dependent oxidoreductase [Paracraurococcus sp. LOR1-02]MDO9711497.1 LLM class flavin-dependent oxidoreductase [Paracraurococcus sp. LOR1-02]
MPKQIRVNAFVLQSPVHQTPGLWRHPEDRSVEYNQLEFWTNLARILERGLFDGVFIADSLGTNDVYGGSIEAALRRGIHVPKNDPLLSISAMAAVTKHLGFGITSNAIHEPPYAFARRMTTLDHLTQGRIGWNIVTGHSESGARATGAGLIPHDERYDIADEYLDLVYALWEGSWEDDAVLRDKARGIFVDPAKVHRVQRRGNRFVTDAVHLAEPSPQRTPVLYQAGASSRGRAFAARHAECIFVSGPTAQALAPLVADTRRRAAANGRDPAELLFFSMATTIVGRTEEEAQAKLTDYRRYIDIEGALVLFSGWTGIDFSRVALDEPVRHQPQSAGIHSALDVFTRTDPDRVWTLRQIAEHVAIGGRGPVFVGSPGQVADAIERWVEESGVDGLNLSYALLPGDYEDFGTLVVPELQRRGCFKPGYAPGTLREKLYGSGRARLPRTHPAAEVRRLLMPGLRELQPAP